MLVPPTGTILLRLCLSYSLPESQHWEGTAIWSPYVQNRELYSSEPCFRRVLTICTLDAPAGIFSSIHVNREMNKASSKWGI